jgi:hypothetical protein
MYKWRNEEVDSAQHKVFPVIEPLEISFAELEVQNYRLEEWEIATIIMEVLYSLQMNKVVINNGRF